MPTAVILGDTYQTVVMPDGLEWMAENLRYRGGGVGRWWNNGAADNGYGAYYGVKGSTSEITTIQSLLADGWRIPTESDVSAFVAATTLAYGSNLAGATALRTTGTTDWSAGGGTNASGFALKGNGRFFYVAWEYLRTYSILAVDINRGQWFISATGMDTTGIDASNYPNYVGIRLVRTYTPPQLTAEAHETTHALSIEWTEAADGTPIAYDDGSEYDYIESTITARLTPSELAILETAWQSATKLYTIYSTGYMLGPLIDMSGGVEVRLMSYQVDQSADSAMTLYDVTIGVHYGPLSAPSAGSLAVVQSRGRPYHSVAPGAASWATEGGTSDVNAYGRVSERSCTWYTHSLTTAQAADVVNALRTLRGSSTTWTAGGVATPWGPSESGTATVWIPSWSVHRESNLLWGVQMELVRNG